MSTYVIACSKGWCSTPSFTDRFKTLGTSLITSKEELTPENLEHISPRYVFFLHWNWIVPQEIYQAFECVAFHVAPLPFGRGGSPIQNLIIQNYESAPLSALRMTDVIDGGPIYCAQKISLSGTIEEIFARIADAAETLVQQIIATNPTPQVQNGDPVVFKRRTPNQSALTTDGNLESLYDQIRMVDGADYPKAFIQHGDFRIEFSGAETDGEKLEAKVSIRHQSSKEDLGG